MMREYLLKTGHDYNDLVTLLVYILIESTIAKIIFFQLNSFTHRLTLHQNQDDIHTDLQTLLDSLENLTIKKEGS